MGGAYILAYAKTLLPSEDLEVRGLRSLYGEANALHVDLK